MSVKKKYVRPTNKLTLEDLKRLERLPKLPRRRHSCSLATRAHAWHMEATGANAWTYAVPSAN